MEIENKFYPIKGFEETHLINPITEEVYSIIKGKILKGSFHKEKNGGYKGFILKTKDYKKAKWKSLHRIIAETFISNPNNYPIINHINRKQIR